MCVRSRRWTIAIALGEQAQAHVVPGQNLDQVAAAATEHEHLAAEWVVAEHLLDLSRQAVEAAAHVGGTGRQPHPGARWRLDHAPSAASTRRSAGRLTSLPTRT